MVKQVVKQTVRSSDKREYERSDSVPGLIRSRELGLFALLVNHAEV